MESIVYSSAYNSTEADLKAEFDHKAKASKLSSQLPEKLSVDSQFDVIHLKENEFVFSDGDVPSGLYFVNSGCVKIVGKRSLTRGRMTSPEFISKIVGEGEFCGYRNLINGEKYTYFAKTLRPTEIHVYRPEVVNAILNGANSLLKRLLSQMVNDLESNEVTEQLHYLASVQERIAYHLLLLSDKFGVPSAQGMVLNLKLTRNELAQLAGTINESLSRHLTEFKSQGIIELSGKEIIIKDRLALMQRSGNFK